MPKDPANNFFVRLKILNLHTCGELGDGQIITREHIEMQLTKKREELP